MKVHLACGHIGDVKPWQLPLCEHPWRYTATVPATVTYKVLPLGTSVVAPGYVMLLASSTTPTCEQRR